MSTDLVHRAIDDILRRISSGQFPAGSALPPEDELANLLKVSRLTMREAVKVLKDRRVLDVIHGRGTFVLPLEEWTDLSSIATLLTDRVSPKELGLQLTQVRRMLEVGAAGLAAGNRSEEDLARLEQDLRAYEEAHDADDVEAALNSDLAFHRHILAASGNPFVGAIMQPLQATLSLSRRHTSALPDVRERAQGHHRKIFEAIAAGRADEAKNAMRAHMTQTANDIASLPDSTD